MIIMIMYLSSDVVPELSPAALTTSGACESFCPKFEPKYNHLEVEKYITVV